MAHEQEERLLGPLLQLYQEDAAIPPELAGAQRRVGVAGVADDQVGPALGDAGAAQGREDLLVVLPVSTTTISSKIPWTDSRALGRFSSSPLTIITRLTFGLGPDGSAGGRRGLSAD